MGFRLNGNTSWSNSLSWKANNTLKLELFTSAHYKQETGLQPYVESDWIFVDINFMREGYLDAVKETFSGSLPFGLSMDNTAVECLSQMGDSVLNDIYKAPEGYQDYKILAWVVEDKYIGIAFENTTETARIACCGVSINAAKLGWGQNWS